MLTGIVRPPAPMRDALRCCVIAVRRCVVRDALVRDALCVTLRLALEGPLFELVEAGWAMLAFSVFVALADEAGPKHFGSEVSLIDAVTQDRFIDVLEFRQRESFGQKLESDSGRT